MALWDSYRVGIDLLHYQGKFDRASADEDIKKLNDRVVELDDRANEIWTHGSSLDRLVFTAGVFANLFEVASGIFYGTRIAS
ncbi:MAG: hypothetical protein AABX51_01220, partial [Nanoarchaeota archaeon]